ncbi:MAG: LysR substrate-binding domain-containing protein [Geminicoccaceae bacterium]
MEAIRKRNDSAHAHLARARPLPPRLRERQSAPCRQPRQRHPAGRLEEPRPSWSCISACRSSSAPCTGSSRPSSPTFLREHAQNIQNEERFVEAEIAATTAGTGGELRIAVGAAWGFDIFPPLLAGLRRTFPGVDVELRVGVRDRLLHELIQGTVDVWLRAVHELAGASGLDVLETGRAEMGVFCARPPARRVGERGAGRSGTMGLGRLDRRCDRAAAARSLLRRPRPGAAARRAPLQLGGRTLRRGRRLRPPRLRAGHVGPEAGPGRGLVPLPLELPTWSFPTGLACPSRRQSPRHRPPPPGGPVTLTSRSGRPDPQPAEDAIQDGVITLRITTRSVA